MKPLEIWQQILAAPADETLKTRYIQALTQAKEARTEVFRLAAELEIYTTSYVQHDDIARQYESALAEWRAELDDLVKAWQAEVNFVKGWPIEITIQARDFIQHAGNIMASLPIRHLNLKAVRESPHVFEVPQLGQIASLDGSHQAWSDEAISALANSLHLASLHWLNLSHAEISEDQVETLAASLCLKAVEHLDLRDNPCRDPVDAAAGYGTDGFTGFIVPESIWLPEFGHELEARHGRIGWLHALDRFMENHPPTRYSF